MTASRETVVKQRKVDTKQARNDGRISQPKTSCSPLTIKHENDTTSAEVVATDRA